MERVVKLTKTGNFAINCQILDNWIVKAVFGEIPEADAEYEIRRVAKVDNPNEPRWNKPYYDWFNYGEFLGKYEEYDAYNMVHKENIKGIILIKQGGNTAWVSLPNGEDRHDNCKTWNAFIKEHHPNDTGSLRSSEIFLKAYEDALAKNKLPPHPRFNKPKGAHTFLGWCDCYRKGDNTYDAWIGDKNLYLTTSDDNVSNSLIFPDSRHSSMWLEAFNLAKEKGLIKQIRDKELVEQINGLRRQIDTLEQERKSL